MNRSLCILLGLAVLAIGPAFADVTVDPDQSQAAYIDPIDRPEVADPTGTVFYVVRHDVPIASIDIDAATSEPSGPASPAAVARLADQVESTPDAQRPPDWLAVPTVAAYPDGNLNPLRRPPDAAG